MQRLLPLLLVAACAAPRSTEPPPLVPPLESLAPFPGGEWVGELPNGMTDTQRFRAVAMGRYVVGDHEVRGADGALLYSGTTVYGPEPTDDTLRWWYFNATGGRVEGRFREEGDALVFEGVNHAPGAEAQTARVRAAMRLDPADPDRFVSVTWFDDDGEWRLEREVTYVRR